MPAGYIVPALVSRDASLVGSGLGPATCGNPHASAREDFSLGGSVGVFAAMRGAVGTELSKATGYVAWFRTQRAIRPHWSGSQGLYRGLSTTMRLSMCGFGTYLASSTEAHTWSVVVLNLFHASNANLGRGVCITPPAYRQDKKEMKAAAAELKQLWGGWEWEGGT